MSDQINGYYAQRAMRELGAKRLRAFALLRCVRQQLEEGSIDMPQRPQNTLPRNGNQIAALKSDVRVDYVVEGEPGLMLRVSGRLKVWAFSFRRPGTGKRTKITLGRFPEVGLSDAREQVLELRYKLSKGIDPSKQEIVDPGVKTVRDLTLRYMDQHAKPNKRTWKADLKSLNREILPRIGDLVPDSVTRTDINSILDPIEKRQAYAQVNRVFALIRGIFRWGLARGYLERDPTLQMKRRHRIRPRTRTLDPGEVVQFWTRLDKTGLPPMTCIALRLALLTGQRIGEVCGAERGEFNLTKKEWVIPASRAKNRKEHRVPLSEMAVKQVELAFSTFAGERYLFASYGTSQKAVCSREERHLQPGSLTQAIRRKLGHLGFSEAPFTPHDFRRTVATQLQADGVREEVVAKILNHSSEQEKTVTRSVYMRHEFWDERRAALDGLSKRISEWIESDPSRVVTPLSPIAKVIPTALPSERA